LIPAAAFLCPFADNVSTIIAHNDYITPPNLFKNNQIIHGIIFAYILNGTPNIRMLAGGIEMLFNYLKIAIRNLYKNKSYSLINIIGLGVAMALCVVGYVNYQFSRSFDNFHVNAENIFLISSYIDNESGRDIWSYSPMPLAPIVRDEVAGVDMYSRLSFTRANLRYENKVFRESIWLVDKDFFNMFTFPIIKGRDNPLFQKNGIVIDQETADKYFGHEDPIGKHLILSPDGNQEYDFIVQSVIQNTPKNSSLPISIVISYENMQNIGGPDPLEWSNLARSAFIMCRDKSQREQVESHLQGYVQKAADAYPDFPINGYSLIPLSRLAYVSRDLIGDPFYPGMHPTAVVAPSVAAFLVLLLACFNFVNTAIAFATKRLKEIGIRKVIGGMRGQLIRQFLGENIILCLLALLVAAILAEIFVPAYDSLWPDLDLSLNYFENLGFVGFILALLLFTALAAGAYPAFYVSRFRPVEILKGKLRLGGTNPLIRILLTLQMALSITAVIAAVILSRNAGFINNMDQGFDKDNVYIFNIQDENNYLLMKDALKDRPDVIHTGVTQTLMARFISTIYAEIEQETEVIGFNRHGEGFFETIGLELLEGRKINPDLISDRESSTLVNEKFVRDHGWNSALGKKVKINYDLNDEEKEYTIIGVVKDFYPNGINTELSPAIIIWAEPEYYEYFAVKYNGDDPAGFVADLQNSWKRLFPNLPFNGFWMDDSFTEQKQVNNSIKLVCIYIAVMVIIITSMGLYALVSLNIARRVKEIGIRKVLGASLSNIGMLISREYIILIIISSILATFLGHFLVNSLMDSIWAYYVPFSYIPFVLSAVLVFVVTALTVGLKIITAANTNPVETLRYE
jgi:putative ABC transport system permease protein